MSSILKIKRTKGYSHVIWEHSLLSIFAFVGMYGLILFGPMFMGGRSRNRARNEDGNSFAAEIMFYFMEHLALVIGICILAVVLTNVYLLIKNTKNQYIVGIDVDDEELTFTITDLYFKKVEERIVPLSDVSFVLKSKFSDVEGKKQTLIFTDKRDKQTIGFIKPNHVIWSDQIRDIRKALKHLNSIGVEGSKVVGKDRTAMGNIFNSR